RRVLERVRQKPECLSDGVPDDGLDRLCREEALLTSKDPELNAATRHDDALKLLARGFRLKSAGLDGDGETLGIAGGICKRRWNDLGQLNDLIMQEPIHSLIQIKARPRLTTDIGTRRGI